MKHTDDVHTDVVAALSDSASGSSAPLLLIRYVGVRVCRLSLKIVGVSLREIVGRAAEHVRISSRGF